MAAKCCCHALLTVSDCVSTSLFAAARSAAKARLFSCPGSFPPTSLRADPNATAKSSATGNWYNTSHSQQNGWDSRTALPHPSHNDLDTYTILNLLQAAKTTETQTLQRISQRGMGTKMVKMVKTVKQIDNPMSLEKKMELQEFCRWPFVGAHGFWRT